MRISTVKKLMIVAVSLLGAAFLWGVVCTVFQRWFKPLYSVDSSVIRNFSVPWLSLFSQLVYLAVSAVLLSSVCRYRQGKSTKGLVITLAVIWGVWSAVLSPILSMVNTRVIANFGAQSLASNSMMTSLVSIIAGPLQTAGSILTLLSLGAFFRSARKVAPQEV